MIPAAYAILAGTFGPQVAFWTLAAVIVWLGIGAIVWAGSAAWSVGWGGVKLGPAIPRGLLHGLGWPVYAAVGLAVLLVMGFAAW